MIYRLVFGSVFVVLQNEPQFELILVHLGVHIVLRGIVFVNVVFVFYGCFVLFSFLLYS